MATKITITADGNQAKAEIGSVAASLDGMGNQATQAAAQTEAAGERIEDALEEVQAEARQTGDSMQSVGGSNVLQGITAASTAFIAMGKALKGVGQLSREAYQGIQYLAEQGNPAARELMASFDELLASMQRLATDPSVQNLGNQLADTFSKAAGELELFPEAMRMNLITAESYWIQFQEAIGIAEEGAMVKFAARTAMQRVELEQQKKRIENEQKANQEAEKAKKLAEERVKSEKEAAEARSQQELDDFEYAHQLAEEEFAAENARIAALAKEEQQEHERRMEQIRREQEAKDERHKKALEEAGAVKELEKQVNDPQKIAERLAENRGKQAEQEALSGGASQREAAAAAEKARRQAFRNAQRQAGGGREEFSREEIQQAQSDNAQATMGALRESGKLSEQTLQALQTSISEAQQQTVEMNAMQDAIKELQRQAQNVAQDGQRRRSQRNSNRQ